MLTTVADGIAVWQGTGQPGEPNAVVVIDLARRELVWSWGQDELSGPHDATVIETHVTSDY